MDCDQFRDEKLLEAYGEPALASEGYRDHVEGCPGCRADLEDLRDLSARYRAVSRERLPAGSIPKPRAASGLSFARLGEWGFPLGAAAAFVLTLGVVFLGEAGRRPTGNREASASLPRVRADAEDAALDEELARIRRRVEELERELGRSP